LARSATNTSRARQCRAILRRAPTQSAPGFRGSPKVVRLSAKSGATPTTEGCRLRWRTSPLILAPTDLAMEEAE
jgi:hypothetical protein